MTLQAAQQMGAPDVGYAVLAGCTEGIISGEDQSADGLTGHLFSLVDHADTLGFACSPFFARNEQLANASSTVFHIGSGHGLFYTANPVWVTPLLDWIDAR